MAQPRSPSQHRATRPPPLASLAALAWLVAGAAAPASTLAGPLADPTRPPAALWQATAPAPGARPTDATGRSRSAAAPQAPAPAAAPPLPPLQLQSVQSSARTPATALIDGRLVRAGDSVGGRTVVSIDAQGVLLRSERGPERLLLLAGSTKQPAGSIQEARSATFVPAPGADADGDSAVIPLDRTGAAPALPAAAKPLSLAGRTPP
jgi:hypothetical protein